MSGATEELDVGTGRWIAKLERRDQLSAEEKRALEDAVGPARHVRTGEDIVREGARPTASTLLLDGFAGRYKMLEAGARQITDIHVAGDLVDLHSFLLKTMDHGVTALTPCTVASISHETLRRISEQHPHLTRLLWLESLMDGAVHREWLVAMGRRSALGHIAHLLCELYLRLQVVGLTDHYSFPLPLTQSDLADAVGLSTVHVNRMVQELRREGMISWRDQVVQIHDWKRLVQVAEFNPTYLNMTQEPR